MGTGLHILVLTDREWTHPQGGGTGTNLRAQVGHWVEWGHRVTIVAAGYRGAATRGRLEQAEVVRYGGRSTLFPRAIVAGARGRLPAADVVLEIINGISFLTPLWLRVPRVALVHHIHREHYRRELGRVRGGAAAWALETTPLRRLYRGAPFVTVSAAAARDVAAHGIPPGQIRVVHNGVDTERLVPGTRTAGPSLLYLGRLKRYKRVELLFDVLDALPEATLDVAGDGDHGPALRAEAQRRGLGARVRFHGYVDEAHKRDLLQRSWVNLCASAAEGWCLAVMEAAACGTPSVAVDVGGLGEAIVDGVTGFLARDRHELVRHTQTLVEDARLRAEQGAAARARALDFPWERTARGTLEVLRAAHGPPVAVGDVLARVPVRVVD